METRQSPYYYLSGQRSVLMGLAILWIVWFHSKLFLNFITVPVLGTGLRLLRFFGYGGVDIFLLVSGMGIYQSLEKNNVSVFFKNRLKKILPVWWPLLVLTFLLQFLLLGIPIVWKEVLGAATFTGYWLNLPNQLNWYGYAIMLFYLASPVLYSLLKNSRHRTRTLLLMMGAAVLIALPFLGMKQMMAASRLPIYIFGMYLSAEKDRLKMTRGTWWLCVAAFLVGFAILIGVYRTFGEGVLKQYALYWWPFLLVAPAGALMVARFFHRFPKQLRFLSVPLTVIGNAAFEILLTSEFLFLVVKEKQILFGSQSLTWLSAIVISVLLGILIHGLIELCKKKCSQLYAAKKNKNVKNS